MRKLALLVYGVVLLSLVSSMWVIERFDTSLYEEEISSDYENHTNLLMSLIIERLQAPNANLDDVLTSVEDFFEDVYVLSDFASEDKGIWSSAVLIGKTTSIEVNADEQTDQVHATASIYRGTKELLSLKFEYIDSYSDEYLIFRHVGSLIVFVLLGAVISLLMFYLYRYLQSISDVTRSIALGRFDKPMPQSRFEALQSINSDIDTMSKALQENAEENIIFLGALHHELRLPITRLRLAMDMAMHSASKDGSNPQGLDNLIRDMDSDLDDLIELSEEMLSLARLSFESGDLEKAPLMIDEVVSELVDSFDDKRIELQFSSGFNNSPAVVESSGVVESQKVMINSTALERVLINVIGNAVKYAKSNISVRVEQGPQQFSVYVEDDGPGIPEEAMGQVLKPFYRVDKGRERSTGGFGLGLSITNSLVRKMGGELKLSRSPEGGLKVEIELPDG